MRVDRSDTAGLDHVLSYNHDDVGCETLLHVRRF
jgi:hypothetical protein